MIMVTPFTQDETVIPLESGWFDFYRPGSDTEILPMRESDIYIQDWIGLRELDETGRLFFTEHDDIHIVIDDASFITKIILPFLQ